MEPCRRQKHDSCGGLRGYCAPALGPERKKWISQRKASSQSPPATLSPSPLKQEYSVEERLPSLKREQDHLQAPQTLLATCAGRDKNLVAQQRRLKTTKYRTVEVHKLLEEVKLIFEEIYNDPERFLS